MQDKFGNTVNIGDKVMCILYAASNPTLHTGKVTKIYKNDRECSVDNHPNVYNYRIAVIESAATSKADKITAAKKALRQLPEEERLKLAIDTLDNYCSCTGCNECKIENAIRCGKFQEGVNQPHLWSSDDILKEGE